MSEWKAVADRLMRDGFVVLRGFFDPAPLWEEFETAFRDGFVKADAVQAFAVGRGTVTTQYLPMMCERTPVSLELVDRAIVAAGLVGRPVLPGRAKGSRYYGDTAWHRDSTHDVVSVGCLAYLERLTAGAGALAVRPGSHVHWDHDQPDAAGTNVGTAIETEPGDVIVIDEHLLHGSRGGTLRHQWRVDFVADPLDEAELEGVRAWYRQSLPEEEAGAGYDAGLYPSWGPFWRSLERPWSQSLRRLGLG